MGKKTAKQLCFFVVDRNGALEDVDPIRAIPDTVLLFILSNEQTADTFRVELKDFKRKDTGAAAMPIAGNPNLVRNLSPGEVEAIKVRLKPSGQFGSAQLPFTTYKYTVEVTNTTAGTAAVQYDPDLDVPPS